MGFNLPKLLQHPREREKYAFFFCIDVVFLTIKVIGTVGICIKVYNLSLYSKTHPWHCIVDE